MKRAVVLVSGGLDSATVLAVARDRGFAAHALTFAYGQRHHVELDAARQVAQALGAASHRVIAIDPGVFAGSALVLDQAPEAAPETSPGSFVGAPPGTPPGTSGSPAVPKDRDEAAMAADIPVTYVPARNTLFLSYALALAETLGTGHIFIGVNAVDYSGYPDCRPEYIAAFTTMANLATRAAVTGQSPVTIHTPLIHLSKADIIRLGTNLGVDYSATHSCYDPSPNGLACGACDSCILRRKGFAAAGVADPTRYVKG